VVGLNDASRRTYFFGRRRIRDEKDNPLVLTVPWSKAPHRRHRDVIAPEGSSRTQVLPIRSDTRVKLVTAIARGRQWLSKIEAGDREAIPHRPSGLCPVAVGGGRCRLLD
jgi:hypothetical protein